MISPSTVDPLSLPSVPLSDRRNLPSASGIYFAIDAEGTIQYIGLSININKRWLGHHRFDELSRIDSVRIAYLTCETDLLETVETALIEYFQPVLNDKLVVRPVPANSVEWHLRGLMAAKRMTNESLANEMERITGKKRHWKTISKWRQMDTMTTIDGYDLDALLEIFACTMDDLLGEDKRRKRIVDDCSRDELLGEDGRG